MLSFLSRFFEKGKYKIHEISNGYVDVMPKTYTSLRQAKRAALNMAARNPEADYAVINVKLARKEFTA